jgi:acetyltransferase-like isoleucine patch superfamily enzyme
MERWTGDDDEREQFEPWLVAYREGPPPAPAARRSALDQRSGYRLDPTAYIAESAHVIADRLSVGERSTIAAGCVLRGEVSIGAHTSLNAGASTIGRVTIGSGVRIATGAVLVGENHRFDDPDVPIALQGLSSEGVVVEDDVWIGANVTVVDGVLIGAHSVIGAGAVVTRDVPAWSVVGGVPARVLRTRQHPEAGRPTRAVLERFDRTVESQWAEVLERSVVRVDGEATYRDRPGAEPHPRALNDAVEIAGAFGTVPPIAPPEELARRIGALQDPESGLFLEPGHRPGTDPLAPSSHEWDMYGLISCGYALEVLGHAPSHPIRAVEECSAGRLQRLLDRLDWGVLAWPSGAWVDGFATAVYLNRRHHGSANRHPLLWGWLLQANRVDDGMWGTHLGADSGFDVGWLMAVNGYYRLTRGAYAQFGVDPPHPEAAIDTVLDHGGRYGWFASHTDRNACNVLDVVHPLWLLGQQTSHRKAEIRDAIRLVLDGIVDDWVDGEGFRWHVGRDEPGLQGTEMWLSVVHLCAAVLEQSDGLSWTPQGVHRIPPAIDGP